MKPSKSALLALSLFATALLLGALLSMLDGPRGDGAPRGGSDAVGRARERREPRRFPANTSLPDIREGIASQSLDSSAFDPARDLVRVDCDGIWWESDHHRGGGENDHVMHTAVVPCLTRLFELVSDAGCVLEVRDAYRPHGVHMPSSLHKEGRAVDVTCRGMSTEKLAKLCWLAGFDWVLHEGPPSEHVHCSVRPSPPTAGASRVSAPNQKGAAVSTTPFPSFPGMRKNAEER